MKIIIKREQIQKVAALIQLPTYYSTWVFQKISQTNFGLHECRLIGFKSLQTTHNIEKCKKCEIRFTDKTTYFRRIFQTLNTRPARTALFLNLHQFCKPKSSCFMRETDFVFPGIFDVVSIVYQPYFDGSTMCAP